MPHSPGSWGKTTIVFKLPSGDTCLVKATLDLPDVVELGILDEMDSLGMIVNDEHVERVKSPQDHKKKKAELKKNEDRKFLDMMKDPEKFGKLNRLITKVLLVGVVEPVIYSAYDDKELKIPNEKRVIGRIYSDTIPYTDKMEIFNYVMTGVRKLEPFLSESEENLGDMADESKDADSS